MAVIFYNISIIHHKFVSQIKEEEVGGGSSRVRHKVSSTVSSGTVVINATQNK
jgi:hypothetical protein